MGEPITWTALVSCEQCWRTRAGSDRAFTQELRRATGRFTSEGIKCVATRGCLGLCETAQGFILRGSQGDTIITTWIGDLETADQVEALAGWVISGKDIDELTVGAVVSTSRVDAQRFARAAGPQLDLMLRVTAATDEAESVRSFLLEDARGHPLPRWTPGAHIDVEAGDNRIRQYSLCGSTRADAPWRIAVLRDDTGRGGSKAVHALKPGDLVSAGGPRNNFALEEAERYLFLAGGIGITPFIPMIEYAEENGIPWQLEYGGRSRRSMAFLDELKPYGDRVRTYPEDRHGLVPLNAILADRPAGRTKVFACGPEPFLDATRRCIAHWPAGTLHTEQFFGDGAGPRSAPDFTVKGATSGVEVRVAEGDTILTALQSAGVFPVAACRSGVCGSCETRILAGRASHRDTLLTRMEREANQSMMLCVSRAVTPRIVLDI
jgi:ferredoxin-NADP reductase